MAMLDLLKEHHGVLTRLIRAQREIETDGMQIGVRAMISIYCAILQDALSTLNSLIEFLDKR